MANKTVILLGAGASKAAGAPLMNNFLDVAEDILKSGSIKDDDIRGHFELVFEGIHQLRRVFSKTVIDIRNIEDVFSAFEMAGIVGSIGDLSMRKIRRLRPAIRALVYETLDRCLLCYRPSPESRRAGQRPFPKGFVTLANDVNQAMKRSRYSSLDFDFITFNYDLALDTTFDLVGIPYDYCLQEPEEMPNFRILKLHGSLNWRSCKKCQLVFNLNPSDTIHRLRMLDRDLDRDQDITLRLVKDREMVCPRCERPVADEAFIAPPTWNRGEYQNRLKNVWREAVKCLQTAENIVVIGYSLPDTDQFFRHLFALGSTGRARLRRFVLVDPAAETLARERYRPFLGPEADQRLELKTIPENGAGLDMARDILRETAFG